MPLMQQRLLFAGRSAAAASSTCTTATRHMVTSARIIVPTTTRAAAVSKSPPAAVSSSLPWMQHNNKSSSVQTSNNRLQQFNRHFATTVQRNEYNMASSDPQAKNNADFQLSEVFNVKNKVALVTGGGSGIGLMAVQALAVNGAKVYIAGRTEEKLERVAETYGKDIPGQIIPITADITSKQDIAKLYETIASKEKCLCILINNAGISTHSFNTDAKSAEELKKALFEDENATFQDWDDIYRTNVTHCYFMTTAFLPLLQKATEHQHGYSGTVVNITSISGQVKTSQHHPQYNASKAAQIHLSRMLANEIQESGLKIRVNNIAPGVFPSEMTAGSSGANQKSAIPKDKYESKVPAQRPGNDRDMAGAVLFACTNQYLNGQTITVDGGYTLAAGR